jgi:hypothetical protein
VEIHKTQKSPFSVLHSAFQNPGQFLFPLFHLAAQPDDGIVLGYQTLAISFHFYIVVQPKLTQSHLGLLYLLLRDACLLRHIYLDGQAQPSAARKFG